MFVHYEGRPRHGFTLSLAFALPLANAVVVRQASAGACGTGLEDVTLRARALRALVAMHGVLFDA